MVLAGGRVAVAVVVADERSSLPETRCRQQKQLFEGAVDALGSVPVGSRGTWVSVEEDKAAIEEGVTQGQAHRTVPPALVQ